MSSSPRNTRRALDATIAVCSESFGEVAVLAELSLPAHLIDLQAFGTASELFMWSGSQLQRLGFVCQVT